MELNRSHCRTSQSFYHVNVHCDALRRAYGMQYFPKLNDCGTPSLSGDQCSWETTLRNVGLGKRSEEEIRVKRKMWLWLRSVRLEL